MRQMTVEEILAGAWIGPEDTGPYCTALRIHLEKQIAAGMKGQHWSWGPKAHEITAEERAAYILEIDAAVKDGEVIRVPKIAYHAWIEPLARQLQDVEMKQTNRPPLQDDEWRAIWSSQVGRRRTSELAVAAIRFLQPLITTEERARCAEIMRRATTGVFDHQKASDVAKTLIATILDPAYGPPVDNEVDL